MTAKPKPLASARKQAEHRRKQKLYDWRKFSKGLVWIRSKGICEIQKKCKGMVMAESHHVYGHGRDINDWREQVDAQLATCRKCHPPAIKHKPAGPKLAWVEEILEKVNDKVY